MLSVSLEKELIKSRKENIKTISLRLEYIGSPRFVASTLSSPVKPLLENNQKIEWKNEHDNKECESSQIQRLQLIS